MRFGSHTNPPRSSDRLRVVDDATVRPAPMAKKRIPRKESVRPRAPTTHCDWLRIGPHNNKVCECVSVLCFECGVRAQICLCWRYVDGFLFVFFSIFFCEIKLFGVWSFSCTDRYNGLKGWGGGGWEEYIF